MKISELERLLESSEVQERMSLLEFLKNSPDIELFSSPSEATSLSETYKIRLKLINQHTDEYHLRLSKSVTELLYYLESKKPDKLSILIVRYSKESDYVVWLNLEMDKIVGCFYLQKATKVAPVT